MTETDTRKVLLGAALLLASSAIILGTGTGLTSVVPVVAIALGALGLAAGALLVGTSEQGRPV